MPGIIRVQIPQSATDTWTLPDGTSATFFPDATGAYRYLATRRGTATR